MDFLGQALWLVVMNMNKIVVDTKEMTLENESVFITQIPSDLVLHIRGNVCLAMEEMKENTHFAIYLEKGSHLLFEILVSLKDFKNKIVFYNEENTVLDFHMSCTYEGDNALEIESIVHHSNVRNYIQIHSVEKNGTLEVKATGEIAEDIHSLFYQENISALTTNNETIKIMPDLLVRSNDVVANHNATIRSVDESELFYLESLGISKEIATSLIKEGFLKGILQIEDLKQ